MVSPWAARAELPGFACKPGSRQEADASRSGIKPIPVARQAAQRIAGFGKYERSPHSALRAIHAGYKPTPVARQAAQRIAGFDKYERSPHSALRAIHAGYKPTP